MFASPAAMHSLSVTPINFNRLPAGVTEQDIRATAATLTEGQIVDLLYCWELWSRAEQEWPAGDWRTWLVMAGRGYGKTRLGAEAVRRVVDQHSGQRIALVGPTAGDCREVMVEGESGLLNVFPPKQRPIYEPSKRRVTFWNGSRAYLYSAEEPERLRGPQHGFAWCLTGDTRVLMADGSETPLAEVRAGDSVRTREGNRRVVGQALTRLNAEVFQLLTDDGRDIIGTSDHPVWVSGRGFIPLADIRPGMSVCVNSASNGTVTSGIATATAITRGKSDCTAPFGSRFTGGFRPDSIFTTLTATKQTTASKISNCFRTASTAVFTLKRRLRRKVAQGVFVRRSVLWNGDAEKITSESCGASCADRLIIVRHFIQPHIALHAASKRLEPAGSAAKRGFVLNAERVTAPVNEYNSIAQRNAIPVRLPTERRADRSAGSCALIAGSGSSVSEATRDSASADAPCLSMKRIASVRRLATRADVYDIAVEGAREFFANGILVHNCDEIATYDKFKDIWTNLSFGLRLGRDPRIVATTTPRPHKWLHELIEDPGTVVSRGSTFDNRANLPASQLANYERIYGGTRIGRQELEGQLLEESEGALWSRETIERARVRVKPDLVRIVIAIDPATTAGEDSDDTGISAFGVDAAGEGYVLADATCHLAPAQWAARAVREYDTWEADRVIGEANNGGDMVELTIRTERRAIPYEKVHASRGKVARAEPVAALYEQGRIHHVGSHPALEDEMVNFVPGQMKRSPNRVDALVWGASYLMLKPQRVGRVLSL